MNSFPLRLEAILDSSIVTRPFQTCLFIFIFFYEKISPQQKHSQANINQQNKVKQTLNNKGNNFLRAETSKRVKVACFAFWCFLCARNLFVKKINRLEIVLITSFYYTTDVYPYQPTYRTSIYMHFFLFVTICENLFFYENLFEFFLFAIICENLFFKSL